MLVRQEQSGFALLLFMIVVIGFIIAGFSGVLTTSLQNQQRINNVKILKQAKEVLLSYAVDYAARDIGPGGGPDGNIDLYRMGKLPCPDANPNIPAGIPVAGREGNQDNVCGATGVNTMGYFPFKAVGMGKIEDAANECLWYVVAGDYKNNPNNMVNRDSVGYLNLVDENDNLKHDAPIPDYPIAFIISPGSAIDQNRTPDAALPGCRANYTLAEYLEGGPYIDYSTKLPASADTLWKFLTVSAAASSDNVNYNDQVVAVYRDELWDRINALNDLSFDNSAGVGPAASTIERLTQSLAVCLASYGTADAANLLRLPTPAPLSLSDYRVNSNYDDDNPLSRHYGRFPQVINYVAVPPALTTNNFVLDTASTSYCEFATGTDYDELFWENWKDHFFYVVSEDFVATSATPANASKCDTVAGGLNCFTVDGKANKVAAMVIFAGPVEATKNRIWWWSDAFSTVLIDNKSNQDNYLEGGNQTEYTGSALDYDSITTPTPNDYSYCVEYDNTLFTLSAVKCADL